MDACEFFSILFINIGKLNIPSCQSSFADHLLSKYKSSCGSNVPHSWSNTILLDGLLIPSLHLTVINSVIDILASCLLHTLCLFGIWTCTNKPHASTLERGKCSS